MEQSHFEPRKGGWSDKIRLRVAKREKQKTERRHWDEENKRRNAVRLQTTIAHLKREIASLEMSIESELAFAQETASRVSLESARMMELRRQNLITTIVSLSEKSGAELTSS